MAGIVQKGEIMDSRITNVYASRQPGKGERNNHVTGREVSRQW